MSSEDERAMIADAINGLLADEGFVARFNRWQDLVGETDSLLAQRDPAPRGEGDPTGAGIAARCIDYRR